MPADTQQGATIVLPDGGAYNIMSITPVGEEVPVVDTTHLGTEGQETSLPGDIAGLDEVTVTVQNDPVLGPPTLRTVGTITITGPVPPTGVSGEVWAGTGFVRKVGGVQFDARAEALQTRQFIVKFDGGNNGGDALARTAAAMV